MTALPDLAVATISSSDVSVLLGAGDGTFAAGPALRRGETPASVSIGDLDGDGAPDLAVANFDSGDVSVLLGNGGRFAAGDSAVVSIGDLDGGRPRPRCRQSDQHDVSVLLGAGDGTFAAGASPRGGRFPCRSGTSTATPYRNLPSPTRSATTSRCGWVMTTDFAAQQRFDRGTSRFPCRSGTSTATGPRPRRDLAAQQRFAARVPARAIGDDGDGAPDLGRQQFQRRRLSCLARATGASPPSSASTGGRRRQRAGSWVAAGGTSRC